MESRAFIIASKTLIDDIENNRYAVGTAVELQTQREHFQKELNQMFSGLQNPTLPSAFRLRNAALHNGFSVSPKVLNELSRFE